MTNTVPFFITDLGDSAVTGTIAILFAAYLFIVGEKRMAAAMLLAFAGTGTLIALGKIILYNRCTATPLILDLRSPSGHSAVSLAVYGTIAAIVSSAVPPRWRAAPYIIAVPFVTMIAVSRVLIHVHTRADIAVGAIIGLTVSYAVWHFLIRGRHADIKWKTSALLLPAALVALHGLRFPAEKYINHIAAYLQNLLSLC